MNKQTAQQLAYLIAAELIGNAPYVEEIVRREEMIDDRQAAEMLQAAIADLEEEFIKRSGADEDLRARYTEAKAQLAEEDHGELIRQLREAPSLFDEGALDG
jgi:hypothetical protein